ncbi:AbrB/MazE/SpoVT family DNA-binding domain-containing protein [Candidatus Bathyarchaeota archaeon]|nr:AbrB/MazE/SpoVT family DNA-binding domain-containing protein [Candidatus Bathyarchaeota archaeon]
MIREVMKVGPKGQVVIPRAIRKALKIEPGMKVTITLEDNKAVLEKPAFDAVAVFERAAKSINYNGPIDPHAAYDEELEERSRRAISRR